MPVNNNYAVQVYRGNGSGRSFNFPFRCFEIENLVVEVISAEGVKRELLQNTEYAVNGGLSNAGGSVQYPLLLSEPALTADEIIQIYRKTPLQQGVDFPTYQQAIENALDKEVMLLQEVNEVSEKASAKIDEWQGVVNDFGVRVAATEGLSANASNDAAIARGNASLAFDAAVEANYNVSEIEKNVNAALVGVEGAVESVTDKVNKSGDNIDRLLFLAALGITPEGEVDFSGFALTSATNIDTVGFRNELGINELEDAVAALNLNAADTVGSNIDTAAFAAKLGLGGFANTAGSNIDKLSWKTELAPRVVSSLSGVTGNYVGEEVMRVSGVVDDPDDDMYCWTGILWRKVGA